MRSGTDPKPSESADLTPEEVAALETGLERVAEEKRQALLDPGPTWREWFFFDAMKWWIGVGFLIVDAWIVLSWVGGDAFTLLNELGAVASLAGALYLEILLYRYLWRRPSETRRPGPFRPGWTALREVGRWTPEAAQPAGLGRPRATEDGSPSPHDFL